MGVDTELIINSKWEVEDIRDIIKSHFELEGEIKIDNTHCSTYHTLQFKLKSGEFNRCMNVHYNTLTPLGMATILTLSHGKEAINIMQTIGDIIGGYFMENDCDGKLEECHGLLNEHNGLAYFLKYGFIQNTIGNANDMEGLQKTIKDWNEKYNSRK